MQKNLFDKSGQWSIDKLKLLEKYLHAYTVILTNKDWCCGVHYIDGFAGGGKAINRETQKFIDASPRIAINTVPPFNRLIFIEKSRKRIAQLKQLQGEFPERQIEIYQGDCNDIIVNRVIPSVPRKERGFLLLDLYALDVDWQTIATAAAARTMETMINFPLMDIFRNVVRKSPDMVDHRQAGRITRLWGSDEWMDAIYPPALFGPQRTQETNLTNVLSVAFQTRLGTVFEYVSDYVVMRSTLKNAPLYSLIWAGHQPVAKKIMDDIFRKYREEHE